MTPKQYEQLTALFHEALSIAPDQRAEFLAQLPDVDAELRNELESLLAAHDHWADYAETPPGDIAAGYLAQHDGSFAGVPSLTAATRIDRYEIRSLLGKGGMGHVYLAHDTVLHRPVALKLLPAAAAANEDLMRRFVQEARAAAALSHPHIAQIFEVGQHNGTHFIAMELVDGVTLRAKIHTEHLGLQKLLKYLQQVADGLAKAHAAGIVHRDLKPDNIMITRDDYAKILDFGLAKLVVTEGPISPGEIPSGETDMSLNAGHSLSGTIMGTAGYMSPEQAQGKVDEIDQRSDIFSFGCILFEAATGHRPFGGGSIINTLHRVVHEQPPLIKDYNPSAPADLQRVVARCLAKNRAERYQNIRDVALELNKLRQGTDGTINTGSSAPSETSGGRTTERSAASVSSAEYIISQARSHKLTAAIILAVLVMSTVVAAYFLNAKPKVPALTDQDTILIADFDNQTGDQIFDDTLKQGLAVQLEQSPFLNLFSETRVRDTLRLMNRSPEERVTAEIGREICQRQGLKALIAGSIAPLGTHYVVTLTAINSNSGEVVARDLGEAESREQVLKVLSQVASRLREKLGESLSSIQKFDAPLEATTSSLEALKAYSLGQAPYISGKILEAIPYYKRAVEIDANFALAHKDLAFSYFNTGQFELAAQSAEKAYVLRDHVSEGERLTILDAYYAIVTGELEKKIENAELRKRLYPRNSGAFMNLSASHVQLGQFAKAVPEASEALRLSPNVMIPYVQLGNAFIGLNRFAEARGIFERALKVSPDLILLRRGLFQISFVGGDAAGMQEQLNWAKERPDEYAALEWQSGAAAFAGQWQRAQELSRNSVDGALRVNAKQAAADYLAEAALRAAVFDQCNQTKAAATQSLGIEGNPLTTTRAVLALALCGEGSQAQRLIDEMVQSRPVDTRINIVWAPTIRAALELRRGNAQRAVQLLEQPKRFEAIAQFWPQYLRGLAYLKLKQGGEAAAEFQKIMDHRGEGPLSVLYPLAQLELAHALTLSGDAAGGRKAYEEFFALWKDADAGLPVLTQAKREYEKL